MTQTLENSSSSRKKRRRLRCIQKHTHTHVSDGYIDLLGRRFELVGEEPGVLVYVCILVCVDATAQILNDYTKKGRLDMSVVQLIESLAAADGARSCSVCSFVFLFLLSLVSKKR